MMDSKRPFISRLGHYAAYLLQYRGMLRSMAEKEFKGRFKYTALGYGWHLITPVFLIAVYYLIFSTIFSRDIPNYWAYISTGMFAFTFMSTCISGGCNCIVQNSGLVTKVSFPREILIFSKVLSALTTLVISYCIVAVLMLVTGVGLSWSFLFVPLIIVILVPFLTGLALLLSALTVYYRDISNAVGLVMGVMMFALPVVYVVGNMSDAFPSIIWYVNPLFYFIECIHDSFYWGVIPDLTYLLICIVCSAVMFAVGLYAFKRLERGFAERLRP